MIQQKPIHAAPPHLQCMLLCKQKYDYTIQYKPGKEMVLADHLSHFPCKGAEWDAGTVLHFCLWTTQILPL